MLPIGSQQTLAIPGVGLVKGRVVWQLGRKAGFEFDTQVEMRSLFVAMLEASRNDPPGTPNNIT
jgi:hypothetical protein